MIKTVIIEDEFYIRESIKSFLNILDKGIDIVGEFGSISASIKRISKIQPTLVLLDIQLLDGNAFDFLEKTKDLNFHVIFITSFDNYAIKALKSGAIDYILKPIDIDELEVAIDKVILIEKEIKRKMSIQCGKITLHFINETQIIDMKDLIYCKSNKGYTTFYMLSGKEYVASKPLKKYEKILSKCCFIRAHQSYFINTEFINKFDSKKRVLYLVNNISVPVSARKVPLINDFFSEK